jgi:hypothetical protein
MKIVPFEMSPLESTRDPSLVNMYGAVPEKAVALPAPNPSGVSIWPGKTRNSCPASSV